MRTALLIGLGGFLGSVSRHFVSNAVSKVFGTRLPYGTLAVNLTGCFLIGLLMELALEFKLIPLETRLFLTTGFLGGFTTFSTFTYETVSMVAKDGGLRAGVNAILHLSLGMAMVWLGRLMAQRLN